MIVQSGGHGRSPIPWKEGASEEEVFSRARGALIFRPVFPFGRHIFELNSQVVLFAEKMNCGATQVFFSRKQLSTDIKKVFSVNTPFYTTPVFSDCPPLGLHIFLWDSFVFCVAHQYMIPRGVWKTEVGYVRGGACFPADFQLKNVPLNNEAPLSSVARMCLHSKCFLSWSYPCFDARKKMGVFFKRYFAADGSTLALGICFYIGGGCSSIRGWGMVVMMKVVR